MPDAPQPRCCAPHCTAPASYYVQTSLDTRRADGRGPVSVPYLKEGYCWAHAPANATPISGPPPGPPA